MMLAFCNSFKSMGGSDICAALRMSVLLADKNVVWQINSKVNGEEFIRFTGKRKLKRRRAVVPSCLQANSKLADEADQRDAYETRK
eukprot:TRINITY_DN9674_c0_g1_i1.p2 TRINITY_DN9674_c0_g1~~TRINITY_DN9674_c0_g1_i1.p2  ORF type:complete len:86 (-),score=9.89 TRINITY_DN9674_c0_g1_i1:467-724(-)